MLKGARRIVFLPLICVSLALSQGCGGGSDEGGLVHLSGSVTDETGSAIQGARVILMERATHQEWETSTFESGDYRVSLPSGTYDIAFDAPGFVTTYKGPLVLLDEEEQWDIVLPSSENMALSRLYGRVMDAEGNALSDTRVTLSSTLSDEGETTTASTHSNSDGFFELAVVGELALDLDFSTTFGTSEFIDIVKLDKPCYVEVRLGAGVENSLRHDQSAIEGSPLAAAEANPQLASAKKNNPSSPYFYIAFYKPVYADYGGVRLDRGLLKVGEDVRINTQTELLPIRLRKNGSWFYTYALHYPCNWYESLESRPNYDLQSRLSFKDESGDVYATETCAFGWKKISYDSDAPEIRIIWSSSWGFADTQ